MLQAERFQLVETALRMRSLSFLVITRHLTFFHSGGPLADKNQWARAEEAAKEKSWAALRHLLGLWVQFSSFWAAGRRRDRSKDALKAGDLHGPRSDLELDPCSK